MNHTNHTASIVFPFPKSCEAAWEGQQPLMTHMLKLQMWLGSTWRRQAPPLLYTGMTGIPCIVVAALASAMPAHIAQLDIYELCGEGEVYSSGGACLRHACLPPPCVLASAMPAHIAQLDVYELCGEGEVHGRGDGLS